MPDNRYSVKIVHYWSLCVCVVTNITPCYYVLFDRSLNNVAFGDIASHIFFFVHRRIQLYYLWWPIILLLFPYLYMYICSWCRSLVKLTFRAPDLLQLLQYDTELSSFQDRLCEHEITFPPRWFTFLDLK